MKRLACVVFGLAAVILTPGASATPDTRESPKTASIIDFSSCTKPVWPEQSLKNKDQGTVQLGFLIGVEGDVKKSVIIKSSGFPLLDEAARKALSKCRFKPATDDGVPVQARLMMQYVWALE
jgi:protein TonB